MGVFEHFPYVNFHELNLSWIVNKLKELEDIIGSQIVDIVARAGVAANAQAINDLSTTVTNNATTAHNESLAAQNRADVAYSLADTANNTANALTTQLSTVSVAGSDAITLQAPYTDADISGFVMFRNNKTVTIYVTVGGLSYATGDNLIGIIADGYRPRLWTSEDGNVGTSANEGEEVRVTVTDTGQFHVYTDATVAGTLRITITYICR